MKKVVYEVNGGNLFFDEETGAICGCDKEVTEVDIPTKINGVDVTSIGESAFRLCNSLTEITIPDSVTSIGQNAFWGCHNLTAITIPDSVTTIGDMALNICYKLTEINVDSNNKNYSSIDGVLFDKSKNTLVLYPKRKRDVSYVIPDSVTRIENRAFTDCWYYLENITIPDSVISIGDFAFSGCERLTDIAIPDSITSIGEDAFYQENSEFTISCCENSYAKQYVVDNDLKYVIIDSKGWRFKFFCVSDSS